MKWESRKLRQSRWHKYFAWRPIDINGHIYWLCRLYRRRYSDGRAFPLWRRKSQYATFEDLMFRTNHPTKLDYDTMDLVEIVPNIHQTRWNPEWDRAEIYDGKHWILCRVQGDK